MSNIVNSNCRKCPDYINNNCDGKDAHCMCKYCPRNLEVCLGVKWCRESESPIILENEG